MLNRLDDMLNFNTQALRIREQRQQVLASNIANADTPNYKARDQDFMTALQCALQGTSATDGTALATTAPGHLAGNPGVAADAGLLYCSLVLGCVVGFSVFLV